MSHSADPVLHNPFRYPSNAVANMVDAEVVVENEEDGPNLPIGNDQDQLSRSGESVGGGGLRARRVSRQEMQPPRPNRLDLSIPLLPPHFPPVGLRSGTPAPSPEETNMEGEQLFVNFIHEEMVNEGLSEPEEFTPRTPPGISAFQRQGRRLRQIADEFSRSHERQNVRDQANLVDLANIQQHYFLELLEGLFNDGDSRSITFERIVVLFFFIRDLAVRAIRQKINSCFLRFMEWSVSFIRQHVCQWVQQNGGWEAVLEYVFAKKLLVKAGLVLLAVGATLTIAGAIIYWQSKNT